MPSKKIILIKMEINFDYTGIDIIYQCNNTTEKINDIFH